ncbi:5-oxoprolinase subunit PxpA [Membranihabitans maritimus]|uniref:5-oxoprolinase subunit PxpA n=1 Tax=Membranihabitans maritimus TaxID=2904244 RepID=UPI001F3D4D07|nr:5-oxoprolinase subunit PxpA [Membranihabitans maritimus]
METSTIDINCDLGESYGRFQIGNDERMMDYISSCNIACGFHGGDPHTIQESIRWALSKNVAIGAHVSYPDLMGFGRRSMKIVAKELYSIICYQISALSGMITLQSGRLHHLKLHGALYNDANNSEEISKVVIEVLKNWPEELWLYCPDQSVLARTARKENIKICREVFIDRRYEYSGELTSRTKKGAVIKNQRDSIDQLTTIIEDNKVKTYNGGSISLFADTVCLHGDHNDSAALAKKVNEVLESKGVWIKSTPYL